MAEYADIVVDITSEKLDRVFQYEVPQDLEGRLEPGTVVRVPFGNGGRVTSGYVTGISHEPRIERERIRQILETATDSDSATAQLVSLAVWMKKQYGCTMIQALRTVIPVRRKIRDRESRNVCLLLSRAEAYERLELYVRKHQSARARLLEALISDRVLPVELVREKLNITTQVLKALEEQQVIEIRKERIWRNPMRHEQDAKPRSVELNAGQRNVVRTILDEWDMPVTAEHGVYLLHGVTGSGKTEVYLELIEHARSRGQQAIVLIPEIALTYQTVLRFYKRFGDRVSFVNSRLSQGERYDQFERARNGEIDVMIGPRSALFTPFPNLGIIVIDEEHEGAYISESAPRYHAVEVAVHRGLMQQARVVLGSATPSVTSYSQAERGIWKLLELPERAGGAELPQTRIVDLRQELKEGNRSIISRPLHDALDEALANGRQAMLFLNRRGYAGFVSCRSCGYVPKCPHCDVSLSLHREGRMVCHYCGYTQKAATVCPSCGSPFLRPFKAGTQQIEDEVKRQFPQARVLRMDLDTTRGKDAHASILSSFAGHEADILIGTQMIVKGHDFPDVTVMGILAADLSLHIPDYRSSERTFQLLTQAAGRAGRARGSARVFIQSYDTEHYSITCAAAQDYKTFYTCEMAFREMAGYPPAGSLTALHMYSEDKERLDIAADYLKAFAVRCSARSPVEVLGPVDEPVAKIQDVYRKVIWLRSKQPALLRSVRLRLEQYIEVNEGFAGITIQYETV